MMYSEFDKRRIFTWEDFLIEEVENVVKQLPKDEKKVVNQLIEKGFDYQEQLNEEWLKEGFMSYEEYTRQMTRFICLQDMIIDSIRKYLKNCKEYENIK